MDVLVTGGTGLIGRALVPELLARGDRVAVVTRNPAAAANALPAGVDLLEADPAVQGPWLERARNSDVIVNLVGESVASGIWTAGKKRKLRRSRLRPINHLADTLRDSDRAGPLISASATGYYGDGGERALGENAEPGHDYLAILCYEWERNAMRAEREHRRVALLRFGIVLATGGGALPAMLPAFRRGLGGPMGGGRQYLPWIHIRDVVRAITFVIDTPDLRGPVNVTTPNPPQQREFAQALGEALGKPARLPAPAWALRLLLGEKARLVLQSQRAVPNRLKAHGFRWEFGELDRALADLLPG
ncbi:MAG: TIGR01777 family oxidoreductase [Candidatus Krumholzibacteriia bacterium]